MNKTKSRFALALLLSLLVSTLSFAAAASPLKLVTGTEGNHVTVSVVTAQTVTLSNYDIQLEWDKSVFSLDAITNGQPDLMTSFQKNTATGKISAMGGGSNVTVPAGQTLAMYELSVIGAASGTYDFTLNITDVANEDGVSLPWKGASTVEPVTPAPSGETEGISGLTVSGGSATATVRVSKPGYAFLAAYDGDGRLLSVDRKLVSANGTPSFPVTSGAKKVKLFVLDTASYAPLCAEKSAAVGA